MALDPRTTPLVPGDSAGHPAGPNGLSRPAPLAAFLLLGLGLFTLFQVHYYQGLSTQGEQYFVDGRPVMGTNDSYFYLNQCRQLLESAGVVTEDRDFGGPLSGLSVVAYVAARALNVHLHDVAFYLPPLLALLMLVPYLLFGFFLGKPLAGPLAFVASLGSLYWMARTRLGYFDTDCLNPFFFLASALAVYGFTRDTGFKRLGWLALFLGLCTAVDAWWPQVRHLVLVMGLLGYALTLPFASSRFERVVKLGVLLLAAGAAADLAGLIRVLPSGMDPYLVNFRQYVAFLWNGEPGAFIPASTFISELTRPDAASFQEYLVFFLPSFLTACLGTVLLFVKKPRLGLHMAPLLGMGLLSIFSYRFLIFLVPLLAMGQGYLMVRLLEGPTLPSRIGRLMPRAGVRRIALALVVAVVLLAPVVNVLRYPLKPSFSAEQYRLAQRVNGRAPAGAKVWCWWDFGYFLHYVTRLPVVSHGGTMEQDTLFTIAAPLAEFDSAAAANWMRFIAEREVFGFRFMTERLQSVGQTREFLDKAFARPRDVGQLLADYGVGDPSPRWLEGFLFPAKPVLLYLDPTMLHKVNFWFELGTWDFTEGKGRVPDFYHIPDPEGSIDPERRMVRHDFGGGAVLPVYYGQTCELGGQGLTCTGEKNDRLGTLIFIQDAGEAFFLGQDIRKTLVARLLLTDPETTPGFEPVYHDALEGGWWLVNSRQ